MLKVRFACLGSIFIALVACDRHGSRTGHQPEERSTPAGTAARDSGERPEDDTTTVSLEATKVRPTISAGADHSCALIRGGVVRCWGGNHHGQLGDGTQIFRPNPVVVEGLTDIVEVEVGTYHSCALSSSGSVSCWGRNHEGQLGDESTKSRHRPVKVAGVTNAVSISAGFGHSCALLYDGSTMCWGKNTSGQLGDGTSEPHYVPTLVKGLTGAIAIAAGNEHTCAIGADSTVYCWGNDRHGQLGRKTKGSSSREIVQTLNVSRAVELVAGKAHTCALLDDGAVSCWGRGAAIGRESNDHGAKRLDGNEGAISVAAGGEHTCVASRTSITCMGKNDFGQIGDGTFEPRRQLAPVKGTLKALFVVAGVDHSCAGLADGTIRCWGKNHHGQLGNGRAGIRPSPVIVRSLEGGGVVALAVGGYHSCALIGNGTVSCWGKNMYGQIGNRTTTSQPSPTKVTGLPAATSISGGPENSCAVLHDGTVWCWGLMDEYEQAMEGPRTRPDKQTSLSPAKAVFSGGPHHCALRASGEVHCTGGDFEPCCGDDEPPGAAFQKAASVALGGNYTCALLRNRRVTCLVREGDTLADVRGPSGAVMITSGLNHACAALGDGTARCWGGNRRGQLGDGTVTSGDEERDLIEPEIVRVHGLTSVMAVTSRGTHSCALHGEGRVSCWGSNEFGQLGDGTTMVRPRPVVVQGLTGVSAVASGGGIGESAHSCALLNDGTVKCWGSNLWGQLGEGVLSGVQDTPRPVCASGVWTQGQCQGGELLHGARDEKIYSTNSPQSPPIRPNP